jgi:putative oxidoreductase
MASQDIPFPSVMLVGAIVFMILGSLSVILGYKTNTGCILLLIFLVAATYYFHDFWNFSGGERQKQLIQFLKNVSIFGGILFILANGTGNFSLKKR